MTLAIILGALVGVIMGLTGAGGGILAVPLLVFGLKLTVAQAGPISSLAVGIAASMGAVAGLKAGSLRYRAALLVAALGILLAPGGVWLAQRLDTRILSVLFAVVLLWVAYKSFRESGQDGHANAPHIEPPCILDSQSGRFIWSGKCAGRLTAVGGIAGMLSGFLGVGGGFIMVPGLQRYTNLPMQSVVATSLAVIALVSTTSVATSISSGHLNLGTAAPFAAGAVAGMLSGSALSSRLPSQHLKLSFAVICLIVAVGMVFKAVNG